MRNTIVVAVVAGAVLCAFGMRLLGGTWVQERTSSVVPNTKLTAPLKPKVIVALQDAMPKPDRFVTAASRTGFVVTSHSPVDALSHT